MSKKINVTKASQEKLNNLHNSLTEYLIEMLDSGEEVSGSVLSTATNFLKNNGVIADVAAAEDKQDLSSKLESLMNLEYEDYSNDYNKEVE